MPKYNMQPQTINVDGKTTKKTKKKQKKEQKIPTTCTESETTKKSCSSATFRRLIDGAAG